MAQISTASMGKFDKRQKTEAEPIAAGKILKKKSNAALNSLEKNRGAEKDRNLGILKWMGKAEEASASKKNKGDHKLDVNKMLKSHNRKQKTGKK